MKIRRLLYLLPATTIAALLTVSCGSDDSCDTPITITPGTWCITLQSTQNTCNITLDPTPYTADYVQVDNYLSAISQYDHIYAGTICGNNANMTGDNSGITTNMNITFSNASTASGSVDWDTGSCTGTDTFVAFAGNCPL